MSLLVKAPLALVTLIRAQPNVLDINLIKGFHIFPKGLIFSSVYSTLVVLRRNWEHCLIVQACHCDKREQAAMNHQDYSATTRWPNSWIFESNSSSIRVQAYFESIQFSSKGQRSRCQKCIISFLIWLLNSPKTRKLSKIWPFFLGQVCFLSDLVNCLFLCVCDDNCTWERKWRLTAWPPFALIRLQHRLQIESTFQNNWYEQYLGILWIRYSVRGCFQVMTFAYFDPLLKLSNAAKYQQ